MAGGVHTAQNAVSQERERSAADGGGEVGFGLADTETARVNPLADLIQPVHADRPVIGARWSIDVWGTVSLSWPSPGQEASVQAMGWLSADEPVGIIEFAEGPIDARVRGMLEARFPGRTWRAGQAEAEERGPRLTLRAA